MPNPKIPATLELAYNRLICTKGLAEITVKDSVKVLNILHGYRPIYTHLMAVLIHQLWRDVPAAKHCRYRIARHNSQNKEDKRKENEQHRDCQQQSLQRIPSYAPHITPLLVKLIQTEASNTASYLPS